MSFEEPVSLRNSCRRRLQNTFEDSTKNQDCNDKNFNNSTTNDRSVLSVLTINDNTRKIFRNGVERITKSLNSVRTSFGNLTQKFRSSTRRRQILEEGPMTPNVATPQTFSKQVLGRTPTKLYSPFGIETPRAIKDKRPPPRI